MKKYCVFVVYKITEEVAPLKAYSTYEYNSTCDDYLSLFHKLKK